MINEDYTRLNCKVRNSNPANKPVYAFTQLKNILDYNMTFGSKQNEYRATRGQLGDGLKRIIGLPFILMNMGDDTSAFFKKQWVTPMFFRANGIERQAVVKVNLGASEAINQITDESPAKLPHTDTEIEITLPIIDEVKDYVTLATIERHCRLSILATTDISFDIEIVDKAAQAEGYRGKAIISLEAKHPIPKNPHNSTSILIYRPAEFVSRIESVFDRENTSVYQVIRKFEEGAQMPKSVFDKLLEVADVNKLSLSEFMNRPEYQKKMLALYNLLMEEADK
jgi:cytidylate kinase